MTISSYQSSEKVWRRRLAVYLPIVRSWNNFTFSWEYGPFSERIWVLLGLFLFLFCFYHSVYPTQNLCMHAKVQCISELQSQSLGLFKGRHGSSWAFILMLTRNYARVQLSSSAEVLIMSLFAKISVVLKETFGSL